jgi:hypothetical protein
VEALLVYVLLRFQVWLGSWTHSFSRLLTLLRAALWQARDLAALLRRYGTARLINPLQHPARSP